MPADRASLAAALLALHRPGEPVVLVNAWDPGSARVVQACGAAAIATGSAGIAFALGRPDGEQVARDEMMGVIRAIASSVDLPVTADIEAGYGPADDDVAETVARVLDAGAVGVNLQDIDPLGRQDQLIALEDQLSRIRAARSRADREGVHLVINARCDVYLAGVGEPSARLTTTVERANAYLAAGADCVFVPGLADATTIEALVPRIHGPLNILASPQGPTIPELAKLGVARISLGSWPARAGLSLLMRAAAEVLSSGTFDALEGALPYRDAQQLFAI
jgi:2-methylisocitrate lyase-like PEP mutase family enzyme